MDGVEGNRVVTVTAAAPQRAPATPARIVL